MKQGAVVLCVLLLWVGPCLAEGPQIRHSIGEMTPPVVRQGVDLWIDATGPWSLWGQGTTGISFLDHGGHIVGQGQLAYGAGPGQSPLSWEIHFDLQELRVGRQTLQMQLVLEGAQGILGLPLSGDTWILPLNNHRVRVERRDKEAFFPASGQWFLLQPGDRVFSGGQEVFFTAMQPEHVGVRAKEVHGGLWWSNDLPNLETGEWGLFALHLQGPSPAGSLVLNSSPYLRLGADWSLFGQVLDCSAGSAHQLTIHIPELPAGLHTLTGSVQALLPPVGGRGDLAALWQGQGAFRQVAIGRTWFDHGGLEKIQVNASTSLILPDGQRQHMSGHGVISIKDDHLNAVIPRGDPGKPLWTGLPLSESVVWTPNVHPEDNLQPDFFMPVLLWDQGFTWRLLSSSGPWFLDLAPEQQLLLIQGEHGFARLEIVPGEKKAIISSTWQDSTGSEGWQWGENVRSRTGIYSQDRWRFTIDIPREAKLRPSLSVQYRSENFGVGISQHDLALRFSSTTWAWGARLNPPTIWLESNESFVRYGLNPQRLQISYPICDRGQGKLEWNLGQNIQVGLRAEPWEAYLNMRRTGQSEGGLRYKQASSRGRFLSLVKAGLQLKNRLIMLEAGGELGYVIAPWCTLYLEGGLGANILHQGSLAGLDLRYGGGVIVKPLPQVVIVGGWNSTEEWYLKAGVVVPFVGRKTQEDFE